MRILALDTSGRAASAAVAEGGRLLARFWLVHGRTHAEALMPCVEAALGGLCLEASDIGAFAAVVGPGSFTGLRVGVSCAKAMAFAVGAQTIAVPALDALARSLLPPGGRCLGEPGSCLLACPMTDARNRQVYAAAYRATAVGGGDQSLSMLPAMPAAAIAVETLAVRLAALAEGIRAEKGIQVAVVFNGDAAEKYFGEMRAALPCDALLADELCMLPDAASAALVACGMAARGEFTPPAELAPLYLRVPQAERLRGEMKP